MIIRGRSNDFGRETTYASSKSRQRTSAVTASPLGGGLQIAALRSDLGGFRMQSFDLVPKQKRKKLKKTTAD